jgi:hypothetical protein
MIIVHLRILQCLMTALCYACYTKIVCKEKCEGTVSALPCHAMQKQSVIRDAIRMPKDAIVSFQTLYAERRDTNNNHN